MYMRLYKEYVSSTLLNYAQISILKKEIGQMRKGQLSNVRYRFEKNNFQFGYAIGKCGVRSITKCKIGSVN